MECFIDAAGTAQRRFLVSSTMEGFSHPYFAPTAEILAWNGVPVERAVLAVADNESGGNEAARFARGLDAMTLRPLTFSLPPDEHYVVIEYRAAPGSRGGKEPRGIVLPWTVATGAGQTLFRSGSAVSIAENVAQRRIGKKMLWCREELLREYRGRGGDDAPSFLEGLNLSFYDTEVPGASSAGGPPPQEPESVATERQNASRDSVLPETFEFCFSDSESGDAGIEPASLRLKGKHRSKRFGYLRIKRFSPGAAAGDADPEVFFEEFVRILDLMRDRAPDGLLLDVRGNPGGSIQDAERLLQLFTPRTIHPQTFHLANTLLLQQLTHQVRRELQSLDLESGNLESVAAVSRASAELGVASADVESRVLSGSTLADGEPLSDPDTVNAVGQRYHGPVVLLVDARTYSAGDIFSAGFKDHGIGEVIGEDANTGGGGASRWLHQEDLVEVFGSLPGNPFRPLPRAASLAIAIRRCLRQGGRNAGQALEDAGVSCDFLHARTRDDILSKSHDLIQFACGRLADKASYRLEAEPPRLDGARLKVVVRTANLERLEFLVDGRPQRSVLVPRTCTREETVPLHGLPVGSSRTLSILGFARVDFRGALDPDGDLTLVAITRIAINSVA
jgi:hypothetical protein